MTADIDIVLDVEPADAELSEDAIDALARLLVDAALEEPEQD